MTKKISTKVLVVGGGPGGYVAAIRAGQLGLDCVLVEADRLGGTCLIRGCIPSKALIRASDQFHAMTQALDTAAFGISLPQPPVIDFVKTVKWKDGIVDKLNSGVAALLKKAKVQTILGWATFSDAKTCVVKAAEGEVTITAEHVILANGSVPVELPLLPLGKTIVSSTEMLSLGSIPKTILVVGAGYIGVELSTAFCKFGSSVTIVEAREKILPLYDAQLTKPVQGWLEREGVKSHVDSKVVGRREEDGKHVVEVEGKGGARIELTADLIFVAVGRRPLTTGWGLENMAVDLDGPFVKVNNRCATSMRNVWAIGDLVGEPMLAHKASAQGEMVAEIIAGRTRSFEPAGIPAICFAEPEIVSVGYSPAEATAAGLEVISGIFPFSASGRALSMGGIKDPGFVRIVARRDDHRVVGAQAVGVHVAELSGEMGLAIEMGAVLEDFAGTIHSHPSLSEAVHEAALHALGHPIHI